MSAAYLNGVSGECCSRPEAACRTSPPLRPARAPADRSPLDPGANNPASLPYGDQDHLRVQIPQSPYVNGNGTYSTPTKVPLVDMGRAPSMNAMPAPSPYQQTMPSLYSQQQHQYACSAHSYQQSQQGVQQYFGQTPSPDIMPSPAYNKYTPHLREGPNSPREMAEKTPATMRGCTLRWS